MKIVTWRWAVKQENNPHCVNIIKPGEIIYYGVYKKTKTRYRQMSMIPRPPPFKNEYTPILSGEICQRQNELSWLSVKQENNPHCVNIIKPGEIIYYYFVWNCDSFGYSIVLLRKNSQLSSFCLWQISPDSMGKVSVNINTMYYVI
jgi:hypothetical protein